MGTVGADRNGCLSPGYRARITSPGSLATCSVRIPLRESTTGGSAKYKHAHECAVAFRPRLRNGAGPNYLTSAQAYELISAPRAISMIFGVFQAIGCSSSKLVYPAIS